MVFDANQTKFAGNGKSEDFMEIIPIAILKMISSQAHSLNIFLVKSDCIRSACCMFGCF